MSSKKNQLSHEKSPYLLQHQGNPVHWYAWSEAAFAVARQDNKPIFLSIGYSTCHWCHVMAHESFEDAEVAEVLNRDFVCIKVDREERPDVDEIYMSAVHVMGQRGGWPLSMFLTPDLKPFYGGTYWPKPAFLQILAQLDKLWKQEPAKIGSQAESLVKHLQTQKSIETTKVHLDEEVFRGFFRNSLVNFDRQWGGFGSAPKFPHAMQLSMLLRIYRRSQATEALQMVIHSLDKMARGGLYDHLGGGFARYSTDGQWLIPHFEKMLYDNALLTVTYLEAFQVTRIEMFEQVARETLDYVLKVMTHPEGGFYSAEDADSEGVEGKFYVWSETEIKTALTLEEYQHFCKVYNVTPLGNFEGKNHFNLNAEFGWDEKNNPFILSAHQKLTQIRESRIHPHKDDKILTSWNGLMISTMAKAYQVTREEKYLKGAHQAVEFLQTHLMGSDQLLARYRAGEARFAARLEDYAFLIQGLLDLYQCDFRASILNWGLQLQELQDRWFWDQSKGGYFYTDGQDPHLLIRSKEGMDGALPNANGVAALNLMKWYHFTSQSKYREQAEKIFEVYSRPISEYPHAFAQMVMAYDFYSDSGLEVAILEDIQDQKAKEFLFQLWNGFYPNVVVAKSDRSVSFPDLLKGREFEKNQTTFYFCQNQTCQLPSNEVAPTLKQLEIKQSYSVEG